MSMSKTTLVDSTLPWGVLLWKLHDGGFLSNDQGEVLSLDAQKGDLNAVRKMREAATHYGYPNGQTVWVPGQKKISRSTWEDQMADYIAGGSDWIVE